MDTSSTSQPSRPPLLGVPTSIVLAGGLIALAIYFSGNPIPFGTPAATPLATEAAPTAPPRPTIGNFRPVSADDHVRGAADARVTVIEYSDLECPFCKQFHPTLQRLLQEYPNDVRWVYRHMPLEQLHKQAPAEAEAVECAGEQGKFWELLDKIYEVTTSNDGLDLQTLPTLARQVGVSNIPQFEQCISSKKYADRVAKDLEDAATAGGEGTPYTVIVGPDGEKVPINGAQPYTNVKKAVDQLLS